MVKNRFSNIFSLFIILISFLTLMVIFVTSRKNQATIISRAQSNIPAKCNCTDPTMCSPDGCSRVPKSSSNTFDEDRYDNVCNKFDPGYRMPDAIIQYYCSVQQPSCCEDIYKYKDDRLCCFQERWTCHPSLCEGATGNGDCGKYWHLPPEFPNQYGCVKLGANGQPEGVWGTPPGLPGNQVKPTNTPRANRPTPTPTRRPTIATPTKIPTPTMPNQVPTGTWPTRTIQTPTPTLQPPQETVPPVVIPTIPKQTFDSPLSTDIILPPKVLVIPAFKINFSNKIKAIKESGSVTVNASSKILDLPTAIFQQIINIDNLLKNKIDSLLRIDFL